MVQAQKRRQAMQSQRMMWWWSAAAWPVSSPRWNACARAKRVALVDRDTPERLGGLALWAFGGMALVGTPLQARMKIPDTPERALRDWLRFGELGETDVLPRAMGALLRAAFAQPGVRLAAARGRQVHARRELGGARHARRRQQRAALPHRLGHVPRTHAPHDCRAARSRKHRAPDPAAPPPRDRAGAQRRPGLGRRGGE